MLKNIEPIDLIMTLIMVIGRILFLIEGNWLFGLGAFSMAALNLSYLIFGGN